MDHDDATIGKIFSRREALRTATLAGFGLAMTSLWPRASRAAAAVPATQPHLPLVASPTLTEGPFFVDEKLNRSNLLEGTKRKSVVDGLPLALAFTVYKVSGKEYTPLTGAQVDIWHADAAGLYSDEDNPMNHETTAGEKWLRGYQLTDAAGNASFQTIFPGWYQGRAPHIHFKVRQFAVDGKSTAEFTSQLFFQETDADRIYAQGIYAAHGGHDTRNSNDGVYAERLPDGTLAGSYQLLDLKKTAVGYATVFPIILTDANLHAGNDGRGGGPGGRREPGGPGNRGDFNGPPGGFGTPPGGNFNPPTWDR